MKKRYVVCLNNSTEEQDKRFIDFVKQNGYGWWHYLKNTWLIIDPFGKSSATSIRDNVKDCFDDEYNIVIELNGESDTWSGFGPNSEKRSMFKWIKENW